MNSYRKVSCGLFGIAKFIYGIYWVDAVDIMVMDVDNELFETFSTTWHSSICTRNFPTTNTVKNNYIIQKDVHCTKVVRCHVCIPI